MIVLNNRFFVDRLPKNINNVRVSKLKQSSAETMLKSKSFINAIYDEAICKKVSEKLFIKLPRPIKQKYYQAGDVIILISYIGPPRTKFDAILPVGGRLIYNKIEIL